MSKCIGEILDPEEIKQIFAGAEKYEALDHDDLMQCFTDSLLKHADSLTVKDLYMIALYEKVDQCNRSLRDLDYSCGRLRG